MACTRVCEMPGLLLGVIKFYHGATNTCSPAPQPGSHKEGQGVKLNRLV